MPEQQQRFKPSVFLSCPRPSTVQQQDFVNQLRVQLDKRGFAPRTLGVTDYDTKEPLHAVRRILLESNGIIAIAFRRLYVREGFENYGASLDGVEEHPLANTWVASHWSHIESAMAFQLGLPILILREDGVREDGVLERGVVGMYMPTFDLEASVKAYFKSPEWQDLIRLWERDVRSVVRNKGLPPRLY